jgi:SWI/SNF-related matrix-associated actin-dependent regulator 1 of chromatin subfamily A
VIKLFPYQRTGVETIEAHKGRCLLADQMGLGKTPQALQYLYNHPELRPAIIICPASIKYGWQTQAKQHFGMNSVVLDGRTPETGGLTRPDILILNYDILKDWLPYLQTIQPKVVIADESHYCKAWGTQRTRALRMLIRGCNVQHFIPISGTPLTNKPIELYPVLNLLWPKKFNNRHGFGVRFCGAQRTPWGWKYNGAVRLKKLNRILNNMGMVRRLKKDVLLDLPPKQRIIVPITIKVRAEYDEAAADTAKWLRCNYGNKQHRSLNKAEALVRVGHLKRLAAKLKLPYLKQWVKDWRESTDEKLILFGIHKAMIKAFRTEYDGQCAVVTGEVTGRERHNQFERFNKDKDCWLFLGNIIAAGLGWSASQCSNVGFMEMDWVPGNHTQAEDRTHGIGRGQEGIHSTAFYLVAHGTIEDKLCEMIQKKQGVLDMTLDGHKHEELDLFDMLCDELMGGSK